MPKFLPDEPNFNFVIWRKITLSLSAFSCVATLILGMWLGLNFGIDFLGGSLIEIKARDTANIGEFRQRLSTLDIGEVTIQEFGAKDEMLIRIQKQPENIAGGDQQAIKTAQIAIDDLVMEYRRIEFVGPTIGSELQQAAIWATLSALIAIMIYVWLRFEWQFGLAAVITLIHDVILTCGLFILTGMEFNLSIVAALLTIAGYSINDTVVIFDRVREMLRKYKKMLLLDLFNRAINQTLTRTILTSLTTEIALLALVIFGGEVLRGFSIALMFGVFIGTYSSYFLAVPLLNLLGVNRTQKSDEDKE